MEMSLDDHLAAWAATVRLPDADADAIFEPELQSVALTLRLVTMIRASYDPSKGEMWALPQRSPTRHLRLLPAPRELRGSQCLVSHAPFMTLRRTASGRQ
jgi:hypothetical protein